MKKLIFVMILIILSIQVHAVDGYKSLKFGMSKEEVLKSGLCTFKDSKTKEPWLEEMFCNDLKMFGEERGVSFYFIEKKLLKIDISINFEKLRPMAASVYQKYGRRSSPPVSQKIDLGAELSIPNNKIQYGFDKDTVFIVINTLGYGLNFLSLVYRSPQWVELEMKNKQAGMENDI